MATEEQLRLGQAQAAENSVVNKSLTPLEQPKFTNLKLQKDIILNSFIFNTIDEYGVVWVITDIEGWWNSPPAEVPDITRGWGDGSYDVQGRYAARSLTLRGTFLTPDPSMVEAARDRLMAAVNLVYRGAWLLTGSDPIRASWVRLSDGPVFNTVNARGRTEFEIPLRAPDPIKYSWNDSQPDGYEYVEFSARNFKVPGTGTVTVENTGNYPVPCLLEVSGPVVGPATLYNRTTDQLIIITTSFGGSLSARVENKQLNFNSETLQDIATLTTKTPHGFTAGSSIYVSGVGDPFDGDYTIESVPTETTLTYVRLPEVATINQVAYKELKNKVATIETTTNHDFSIGETVIVSGVDSVFDGSYVVTAVPDNRRFRYSRSRTPVATVTGRILVSNVATLTTSSPHGFLPGEQVVITGIDSANFNGTYTISSVSGDGLQFSYPRNRTDSRAISNTALANRTATITTAVPHGFVTGERVAISNVSQAYNGTYEISSTPTNKTFTYSRTRSTKVGITSKAALVDTATITTSAPHKLFIGDQVTIEGVDSTFNGTYTVTSVPSNTSFTYFKLATVNPTPVSGGFASVNGRWVVRVILVGGVATLTTAADHGILVGESVTVSDIGSSFNGTYTVTEATNNTFSYLKSSANVPDTSLAFNITEVIRIASSELVAVTTARAALTTANDNLTAARKLASDSIEDLKDAVTTATTAKDNAQTAKDEAVRIYTAALAVPRGPNTLARLLAAVNAAQAALDAATTAEANAIAARDAAVAAGIEGAPGVIAAESAVTTATTNLANALAAVGDSPTAAATVTTSVPHGFSTGDKVIIGGIFDPSFNGYYTITVVSPTQFSYSTVSTTPVFTPGEDEESPAKPVEAGEGAYVVRGKVTYSGTIASAAVTSGTAEVAGSLPFASTSGTATVPEDIERTLSNTGVTVKKNDIQFTPGVENGVVAINADILEIDTQNREVAFNGEITGARAKIDVLADFIKLAPGENIIEFGDDGNVESSAVCKIYYRSGWLS